MSQLANGTENGGLDIEGLPKWLENITLNNAMREIDGGFTRISDVKMEHYSKVFDNKSALMLQVYVDYEVKGGSNRSTTFIMKTQNDANEAITKVLNVLKLFQKEELMYQKILPKFEQLFREVGKKVKFAPKAFTFDRDVGIDYVLLEDLRAKNYKNANRHIGLDLEHMKQALQKLAEYHAASACYVEHFGIFTEDFTIGIYNRQNRDLLKQFNESSSFLAHLRKWKNGEKYYEKLHDCDAYLIDRLMEAQKFNASEFNVLNHGDCWINNILFQYDAFGKIRSTLFVDFQVCKYGSPASDLYYLILSSASMDIKLTQFDYLVRFYYDHLIESLKILQYHRPLPKLKNLHTSLLKNGLAAFLVVTKVLPLVMFKPTHDLQWNNNMLDESKIKSAMYTNPKYVQAMADILPWLDNRGLLDWK